MTDALRAAQSASVC